MRLPKAFQPTLLREVGAVYLALAFVGFLNFGVVLYLLFAAGRDPGAILLVRELLPLGVATAVLNLLVLAWGFWATAHRIVAPINRLREAAVRIAQGDFSLRAQEAGLFDELRDMAVSFNGMAAKIQRTLGWLEAERNFSATLLDRFPEGLAVVDSRGKVILTNPAFRRKKKSGVRSAEPEFRPPRRSSIWSC